MQLLIKSSLLALALTTASAFAQTQVTVKEAWVRATAAQQKATGAFMTLTAASEARLVAAQSPAAGTVEIHESKTENNVMKMRAVNAVALPAGKPVELKPGGFHVMLMDLKAPAKEGESIALTLTIEGKDGKREQVEVKAQVRALTAAAKGHDHGHMKH